MRENEIQDQLIKIIFNLEEQNEVKDELITSQKSIISSLLEMRTISQKTIEIQQKLIEALQEKINNGNL